MESEWTATINSEYFEEPFRDESEAPKKVEEIDQTFEENRDEDVKIKFIIGPEELCRILECPICYDVVLPPIFTCTSGHHLCSNCRNSVFQCPVCRGEFSKERNLLMEKVLDKCEFACKYRTTGCLYEDSATNLAAHLSNCEFRPIRCIECDNSISYDKFISHLNSRKTIERQDMSEVKTGFEILPSDFNDEISKQVWEPTWIYTKGVNFFLNLENEKNAWWLWVSAYGIPDHELDSFLTDIYLWNSAAEIKLKYSGPVHSIRKTSVEILTSGQCLSVLKESIQSLLNEGGIDAYVRIYDAPSPKINPPIEKPKVEDIRKGVAHFVESLVVEAALFPSGGQQPELIYVPEPDEGKEEGEMTSSFITEVRNIATSGVTERPRVLPRKYMNPPNNYTSV